MLAKLHQLLRQCYFKQSDQILEVLLNSDENYLIQRALEELTYSKTEKDATIKERHLKLSIQLINLARYRALGEPAKTKKVKKEKKVNTFAAMKPE